MRNTADELDKVGVFGFVLFNYLVVVVVVFLFTFFESVLIFFTV